MKALRFYGSKDLRVEDVAAPKMCGPRQVIVKVAWCGGKEGVLRGREFGDQVHTFSCLSVLHNAVVGWNILHIEPIVNQLHAEGKNCSDHILSLTTPLMRKHLNPFGKNHFDLNRMRRLSGEIP
jgi:hypothetical protein